MAFDFSKKIQVTNPTAYYLGRYGVGVGLLSLTVGLVTMYTGDILVPAKAWFVIAVLSTAIGAIMIGASRQKI